MKRERGPRADWGRLTHIDYSWWNGCRTPYTLRWNDCPQHPHTLG